MIHSFFEKALRKRLQWLSVFVFISSLGIWVFWTHSVKIYDRDFASRQAVSNWRQIHMVLREFENEYGSWPDVSTIDQVRKATRSELRLGNHSSNDFFRQLLAANFGNESIFSFGLPDFRRRNEETEGVHVLGKGACNLAYIISEKSDTSLPMVIGPVIPGQRKFDREACRGTLLICAGDGSVKSVRINDDGRAVCEGLDLLDPRNSIWKGAVPRIAWPE